MASIGGRGKGGVEEGSKGQAMKGLRCHAGELQLSFS